MLEGLRWLGIDWDEGPHAPDRARRRVTRRSRSIRSSPQDRRLPLHLYQANELDERQRQAEHRRRRQGHLRRSHCRDAGPRSRLRARTRSGSASIAIARCAGTISSSGRAARTPSEIGDGIIRRSDGSPLYHLAVVVDDIDMRHHPRRSAAPTTTATRPSSSRSITRSKPRSADLRAPAPDRGGERAQALEAQGSRVDPAVPSPTAICRKRWSTGSLRLGWSHGDQEIFSTRRDRRALRPRAHVGRSGAQADPLEARLAEPALHQGAPRAMRLFEAVKPLPRRGRVGRDGRARRESRRDCWTCCANAARRLVGDGGEGAIRARGRDRDRPGRGQEAPASGNRSSRSRRSDPAPWKRSKTWTAAALEPVFEATCRGAGRAEAGQARAAGPRGGHGNGRVTRDLRDRSRSSVGRARLARLQKSPSSGSASARRRGLSGTPAQASAGLRRSGDQPQQPHLAAGTAIAIAFRSAIAGAKPKGSTERAATQPPAATPRTSPTSARGEDRVEHAEGADHRADHGRAASRRRGRAPGTTASSPPRSGFGIGFALPGPVLERAGPSRPRSARGANATSHNRTAADRRAESPTASISLAEAQSTP